MPSGRLAELRRLLDSTDLDDVRIFLKWRIASAEMALDMSELLRLRSLASLEGTKRLLAAEAECMRLAHDADAVVFSRIRELIERRAVLAATSEAASAGLRELVAADKKTDGTETASSVRAMSTVEAAHRLRGAGTNSTPCSPGTKSKVQRQIPAEGAREPPLQADLDPSCWAEAPPPPDGFWRPAATAIQSRLVPRAAAGSPLAEALLGARLPVVITSSGLADTAVRKWDLGYLAEELGDVRCTVFRSATRSFRYWDGSKAYGQQFEPDTSRIEMTAREFSERVRAPPDTPPAVREPAHELGAATCAAGGCARGSRQDGAASPRFYLQTGLVEGVGESMLRDFRAFDWAWLRRESTRLGWAELSSNLLLVGECGNVTPAHYDEQQNLFAQLCGSKRVVLFSPDDFCALYPFPVHHPNDRQSMVDFDRPDERRFPRFGAAAPLEATLQPGEVLYIPQYWWHHVENLSHGCVSLNFWFRSAAAEPVAPPPTCRPATDLS